VSTTLPAAATEGNLLLVYVTPDKASGTISIPAVLDTAGNPVSSVFQSAGAAHITGNGAGDGVSAALFWAIARGGEKHFTGSWANFRFASIAAVELANAHRTAPLDRYVLSNGNAAAASALTIGPTAVTQYASETAVAFWSNDSASAVDTATGRGWSNSFATVAELATNTANPGVSIGLLSGIASGTAVQTTFSYTGDTAEQNVGILVTLRKLA
jgi:hypothetical protein